MPLLPFPAFALSPTGHGALGDLGEPHLTNSGATPGRVETVGDKVAVNWELLPNFTPGLQLPLNASLM